MQSTGAVGGVGGALCEIEVAMKLTCEEGVARLLIIFPFAFLCAQVKIDQSHRKKSRVAPPPTMEAANANVEFGDSVKFKTEVSHCKQWIRPTVSLRLCE